MTLPQAWVSVLAPPTSEAETQTGSRDPATDSALTPTTVAPATCPSPQSSATRRKTRHASVASTSLESSGLANLDLSRLHVDSDSSDPDYRTSRRPAVGPSHSRSMSNPFPSFFSPKKKKRAQDRPFSGFGDSGSSSDGEPLPTRQRDSQQTGAGFLAPATGADGRRPSFSTGPCITCGSLMRWARGAEAFRCGICLTVNDIVPAGKTSTGNHDSPLKARPSTASPISIKQTRALVVQCLRSYLEAVLPDVDAGAMDPPHLGPAAQSAPAPVVTYGGQPAGRSSGEPSLAAESVTRIASNGRPGQGPSHGTHSPAPQPTPQLAGDQDSKPMKGRRPPYLDQTILSTQMLHSRFLPNSRSYDLSPKPDIAATSSSPINPSATQTASKFPMRVPISAAKGQDEKEAKRIFRPLEDYIISHIFSMDCLDSSFVPTTQPTTSQGEPGPSSHEQIPRTRTKSSPAATSGSSIPELDPKLLLAGDISENGSWWANTHGRIRPMRGSNRRQASEGRSRNGDGTSRPIYIDWLSVDEWYRVVLNAGATWELIYNELVHEGKCKRQPTGLLKQIEAHILKGQQHAQRVLLKAIETVLKRPGRRICESGDFRFLIIALANPLLYASCRLFTGNFQHANHIQIQKVLPKPDTSRGTGPASGQHSGIIKRVLGLISNSSDEWHNRIIACFARFSEARFIQTKDLVSGFLAYRLVRHNEKKEESKQTEASDPLVPKVPDGASAASFHAALSQASVSTKKHKHSDGKNISHGDDWQIKAAVRVLRLLFAANDSAGAHLHSSELSDDLVNANNTGSIARARGQIVPISDFYITLLDNCDLIADFEAWEQQTANFAFCQYPFLLSVWVKIQILEYEARRQMKNKARDAFFDSIMTRRNFDQHLILNVRRDCLVEDSLKGVSAAIGSGTDDIKKGLRIIFNGEEGIDAGGLRKEWFLLLVREVFNPDHGMFVYDEESQYCYFNPASFETSDQFFLVGVVLGLAIYNSTILDVALPPFAFRKLLLAAPSPAVGLRGAAWPRPIMAYTLADLAEYRPRLARGLQQLLNYDGDVESTFCLEFTIAAERYGCTDTVPLCPGGESRPVSNANREEYVNLYVCYLLDTAVSRQFEPFKRGFFTVCGCNALGLFRPEEIELLVRGSDEPLDVASLRLAATYENWPTANPLLREPTIRWFWETFEEASPKDQRKLLIFITGSDRIPATGPASLSIRILCLGNDAGRFPTARTCFNTLTLYRYDSREDLQKRLWGAVNESEGFGLK